MISASFAPYFLVIIGVVVQVVVFFSLPPDPPRNKPKNRAGQYY